MHVQASNERDTSIKKTYSTLVHIRKVNMGRSRQRISLQGNIHVTGNKLGKKNVS